jgi:hypothetical protein
MGCAALRQQIDCARSVRLRTVSDWRSPSVSETSFSKVTHQCEMGGLKLGLGAERISGILGTLGRLSVSAQDCPEVICGATSRRGRAARLTIGPTHTCYQTRRRRSQHANERERPLLDCSDCYASREAQHLERTMSACPVPGQRRHRNHQPSQRLVMT